MVELVLLLAPADREGAPAQRRLGHGSAAARPPDGAVCGVRLDDLAEQQRPATELVGGSPDARLTVVDDASLFVHAERPAEVAQALLPGLTRRAR